MTNKNAKPAADLAASETLVPETVTVGNETFAKTPTAKPHTPAQRDQAVRERMRARLENFHKKASKQGGYAADLADAILNDTTHATEQTCDSLFRTLVTDEGFSAKSAESVYDAAYSVVMGHR